MESMNVNEWMNGWISKFVLIRLALDNPEITKLSFYIWFYFLLVLPGLNSLSKCTHSDLLFHINYFLLSTFLPDLAPDHLLFTFSSQN